MNIKQNLKDKVVLIAMLLFIFLPFNNIEDISTFFQDTSVQIKTGLASIEAGKFLNEEIFSWHEGLSWIPHESLWYVLIGAIFKCGGIIGLLILATITNLIQASIIFKHINKNHQFISAVSLFIANTFTLATYNIRPWLVSNIIFTLLLSMVTKDDISIKKQNIIFLISIFLLGWFHGGIIPLFFLIWIITIVFDIVYKDYNNAKMKAIFLPAVFIASILNTAGINVWTYGIMQSKETIAWKTISEWLPADLSIISLLFIGVWIVSLIIDIKYEKFDKKAWLKFVFEFMFFAGMMIHRRFSMQYAICMALFLPEHLSALINWANEKILHLPEKMFIFKKSEQILVIAVMFVTSVLQIFILPFSLNEESIESYNGFDHEIIETIKDNKYQKVFHEFDLGTWLLYYDIKVAIDNRCDPYMSAYNEDVDLINYMLIENVKMVDDYCEKYKPDAIVVRGLTEANKSLIYELDNYCTDKYKRIYSNETDDKNIFDTSVEWAIYEPVY